LTWKKDRQTEVVVVVVVVITAAAATARYSLPAESNQLFFIVSGPPKSSFITF